MEFFNNVVKSSNSIIKDEFDTIKIQQITTKVRDTVKNVFIPNSKPTDLFITPSTSTSSSLMQQEPQKNEPQTKEQQQNKPLSSNPIDIEPQPPASKTNAQLAAMAADAQLVTRKTVENAKHLGNYLFNVGTKASKSVSETAILVKEAVENSGIIADFFKEQKEFIQDNKGVQQSQNLPWDKYTDEDFKTKLRDDILALSTSQDNFTSSPSDPKKFDFDIKLYSPIASSLLKEDSNLNKIRFQLVPKVLNEERFWKNYFHRIKLLEKNCDSPVKSTVSSDIAASLVDNSTTNINNDTKKSSPSSNHTSELDDEWDKELENDLQEFEVVPDAIDEEEVNDLDKDILELNTDS